MTAWETPQPPDDWSAALDLVDEVWVPSTFCRDALARVTERPIVIVPHPVPLLAPGPSTVVDIPSDSFVFLSVLDWSERKNPLGLLRAFGAAFGGRADVVLLLKLSFRFGAAPRQVLRRIESELVSRASRARVYVVTDELSESGMDRLYRRANGYVSLHRAEGFGLCMAEAMAAGKPVVATAYSGNMDYMDEGSMFPVAFRMVSAKDALTPKRFFDARMTWAEPEHDSAVAALRACADRAGERERRANAGRLRMARELDPLAIGRQMRAQLTES